SSDGKRRRHLRSSSSRRRVKASATASRASLLLGARAATLGSALAGVTLTGLAAAALTGRPGLVPTGTSLGFTTRTALVLVHGWSPSSARREGFRIITPERAHVRASRLRCPRRPRAEALPTAQLRA